MTCCRSRRRHGLKHLGASRVEQEAVELAEAHPARIEEILHGRLGMLPQQLRQLRALDVEGNLEAVGGTNRTRCFEHIEVSRSRPVSEMPVWTFEHYGNQRLRRRTDLNSSCGPGENLSNRRLAIGPGFARLFANG